MKVHFEDFVGSHTQDLVHRKMPRLKQLISRTNQFNSSGKKELSTKEILYYVENKEIKDICNPVKDTLKSMALVSATDRFGHYGDVGLLMYSIINTSAANANQKCAGINFGCILLSCRALQRGVEYKMLQYIGTIARISMLVISFACHLSKRLETVQLLHFWNLFPTRSIGKFQIYMKSMLKMLSIALLVALALNKLKRGTKVIV